VYVIVNILFSLRRLTYTIAKTNNGKKKDKILQEIRQIKKTDGKITGNLHLA
jgi:hypothetical protein